MMVMQKLTLPLRRALARLCLAGLAGLAALALAPAAAAETPSWLDANLLAAAKAEGTLVVYSSINEEEGLPTWQMFEQATGLKVDYIRGSDFQMVARILLESRGGKPGWD